jgi:hypothetical protein
VLCTHHHSGATRAVLVVWLERREENFFFQLEVALEPRYKLAERSCGAGEVSPLRASELGKQSIQAFVIIPEKVTDRFFVRTHRVHGGSPKPACRHPSVLRIDTTCVDICYRPLRVGWAIDDGDTEALRRAINLLYAQWGGRFNPVVVADREQEAVHLVDLFRVDLIVPMGNSEKAQAFLSRFSHPSRPAMVGRAA